MNAALAWYRPVDVPGTIRDALPWTVALIDPLSRARQWLRAPTIDARRASSPHADDAAVARRLEELTEAHRPCVRVARRADSARPVSRLGRTH